jgi:hypothetical protein
MEKISDRVSILKEVPCSLFIIQARTASPTTGYISHKDIARGRKIFGWNGSDTSPSPQVLLREKTDRLIAEIKDTWWVIVQENSLGYMRSKSDREESKTAC